MRLPKFCQYISIDIFSTCGILGGMVKTQQLQIRVTPEQKAALARRARRAGQDVSSYVLSRALPAAALRFGEILATLREAGRQRFALAELSDLLTELAPGELAQATADADLRGLSPYVRNYVAAMVELAAHRKGVATPGWVSEVPPLEQAHFATPLASLRLHLLQVAPVPFKRRNIFVDSSLGDRV
jgi:hypothetical protein